MIHTLATTYNHFCYMLDMLGIEVTRIQHSKDGLRHRFYADGHCIGFVNELDGYSLISEKYVR